MSALFFITHIKILPQTTLPSSAEIRNSLFTREELFRTVTVKHKASGPELARHDFNPTHRVALENVKEGVNSGFIRKAVYTT